MDYVQLPAEIEGSLRAIINQFAFILTMFNKYEDVLKKAELDVGTETRKTLGWLIFITGRVQILNKKAEIVECARLLVAVISLVFASLKEHTLRNSLCEMFKMNSVEPVVAMEDLIKKMTEEIFRKELDLTQQSNNDDEMELAIKKLNGHYQGSLELDEIDERILIAKEMRITTPLKLVPFARQGLANKLLTPCKPDNPVDRTAYTSKRILTYETPISLKGSVTLSTKFNDIKFSQYAFQSPYSVKKLPIATPITCAMEMNNWLQEYVSKESLSEELPSSVSKVVTKSNPLRKALVELQGDILKKLAVELESVHSVSSKLKEVKALYSGMMNEFLLHEEKKLDLIKLMQVLSCFEFHRSVLAASIEIVLFVHNSMTLHFEHVLEICELQVFDFWKLLRALLKFDQTMPGPLKFHFQQIEIKILTSLAWQKNSELFERIVKLTSNKTADSAAPMRDIEKDPIDSALEFYMDDYTSSDLTPPYELFFQRILHVVSSKILTMSEALQITDESTKEKIWEVIKFCLSSETELLLNRHIDQLLLCSIYAVEKMKGRNIKFNTIIARYSDLHPHLSESLNSLFFQIKITEDKAENLINFYNKIFIPHMKSTICRICKENSAVRSPENEPTRRKINALAPKSPLTASLPPAQYQTGAFPCSYASFYTGAKSPLTMMTPRTKVLYAVNETPAAGPKPILATTMLHEEYKGDYKASLRSQILLQKDPKPSDGGRQKQSSMIERSIVPTNIDTKTILGTSCDKTLFPNEPDKDKLT
jgi:retinoblastoma-associated protein